MPEELILSEEEMYLLVDATLQIEPESEREKQVLLSARRRFINLCLYAGLGSEYVLTTRTKRVAEVE